MNMIFDLIKNIGPMVKTAVMKYDDPLSPKVIDVVKYVGKKDRVIEFKSGAVARDISGDVNIIKGNFPTNKKQWVKMKDFSDKAHYKGKDNKRKVDLNTNHSEDLLWYGPNTKFKVLKILAPAPWHGSRIKVSVLNKKKEEICQVLFVHCSEINSILFEKDRVFKPGTYIGRSHKKIGVSTASHLHISILTKGLIRKDLFNIMKGGIA